MLADAALSIRLRHASMSVVPIRKQSRDVFPAHGSVRQIDAG
jgi:hypothetical protein